MRERGSRPRVRDESLQPLDAVLRPSRVSGLRAARARAAVPVPRRERGHDLRRRHVVRRLLRLARGRHDDRTHRALGGEHQANARADLAVLAAGRRDVSGAARRLRAALEAGVSAPPVRRPAAMGHARSPGGAARCTRQPDRARPPVHDAAAAGPGLLREPRAADPVHAREHDVDGLLCRRRARPPGPRALPPADAVLRTRGDRRRRQPGDHRRAGGRRSPARRHV